MTLTTDISRIIRNDHPETLIPLCRLIIGTGMRIGEVLALTRADVDHLNGVINVINGKNGVSRFITVAEMKQGEDDAKHRSRPKAASCKHTATLNCFVC